MTCAPLSGLKAYLVAAGMHGGPCIMVSDEAQESEDVEGALCFNC